VYTGTPEHTKFGPEYHFNASNVLCMSCQSVNFA